jgi:hypothetical protein
MEGCWLLQANNFTYKKSCFIFIVDYQATKYQRLQQSQAYPGYSKITPSIVNHPSKGFTDQTSK